MAGSDEGEKPQPLEVECPKCHQSFPASKIPKHVANCGRDEKELAAEEEAKKKRAQEAQKKYRQSLKFIKTKQSRKYRKQFAKENSQPPKESDYTGLWPQALTSRNLPFRVPRSVVKEYPEDV